MNGEGEILRAASARLAAAGIGNPRLEARVLWEATKNNNPPLEGEKVRVFDSFVARREKHEPVAYITGHREFWSLDFLVEPGVLIPRADSETMIEAVLKAFPDKSAPLSVLDLGTGSGCLLAAVLSEYPNAAGLGIDAAETPLRIASTNLMRLGFERRAEIRRGSWAEGLAGPFDVILCNPPYIPAADIQSLDSDVRDFEPHAALASGPDGLDDIRKLAPAIKNLLRPQGWGFVEIGIGQAESAWAIFSKAGLTVDRVAADLSGVPRIVILHKC